MWTFHGLFYLIMDTRLYPNLQENVDSAETKDTTRGGVLYQVLSPSVLSPYQYSFDKIRLVDLNKLKISTRKLEAEILVKNNGVDPDITEKNAAKSLGGVIVKTFQVSFKFYVII